MRLPQAVVAALLLTGVAAHATTLGFTFSGTDTDSSVVPSGQSVAGSGSMTFTTGLTTVGQTDLSAFSFTTTLPDPNGGSMTFTYGLADLSSFSMTLSGTTPMTLALGTTALTGTDPNAVNEAFTVLDLNSGGASIANVDVGTEATGTVSFAGPVSVPEPASVMLLGMGAIALLATRRRTA